MNRSIGGMLLTAICVAAFALPSPRPHQNKETAASNSESERTNGSQHTKLHSNVSSCPSCVPKPPETDLQETIQEFLGKDIASLDQKIVGPAGQAIDVLIATVPDPVETHLSLFFDRTMDALQQALTREGYLFAGATLPWDSKEHPESDDWLTREGQVLFERAHEETPGLMIYRKRPGVKNANPLFVLVVGETPTTGIHKDQFLRAVVLSDAWSQKPGRLRVLGPTFSGSLYSIIELLSSDRRLRDFDLYLHSGTVTSGTTASLFQQWLDRNNFKRVHFASFQENDDYGLQQFLALIRTRGYLKQDEPSGKPGEKCYCSPHPNERCSVRAPCLKRSGGELPRITDVVLLTEDETAYGLRLEDSGPEVHTNTPSEKQSCDDVPEDSMITTLSFPRDISQLRSAYQQDFLKSEASPDRKMMPRTSLPLDLEDTGGDKDTIASYAHRQTPLSQEAVLFGIIVNFKKLHPDFVVIRATNPLDELFLARFLRKAYPKVRVVTIGADLLFQQQRDDALLEGTLAISPYSLRPDVDRYIPPIVSSQTEHVSILTFPSTFSAGVYNATLSLVECKPRVSPDANSTCAEAPPAPYHEYGWSREWPENGDGESVVQPSLWLLVLGNDGYWPLARLNSHRLLSGVTAAHRTLPQTEPTVRPEYKVSYHLSKDWKVFSFVVVGVCIIFSSLCWIGSAESASELLSAFDNSPDPHRTIYLIASAVILLIGLYGLLLPYEWVPILDSKFLIVAIPIGILCIAVFFPANLAYRQAPRGLQFFTESSAFIFLGFLLLYNWPPHFRDYLSLSRIQHVTSGVSPAPPVYLLLAAFLWWCWKGLQGHALLDSRRPMLPTLADFPELSVAPTSASRSDLTADGNMKLVNILISPFSGFTKFFSECFRSIVVGWKTKPNLSGKFTSIWEALTHRKHLWVTYRVAIPAGLILCAVFFLLDPRHPIYSLEGTTFDRLYAYAVALALFLLCTDLARFLAGWLECRRLLRALEQLPLRRGFDDIKGFSWRPIWRLGGGPSRILAREWESWQTYHLLSQGKLISKQDTPAATVCERNDFFAKRCSEVMRFLVEKWTTETDSESKVVLQVNCSTEGGRENENDGEPSAVVKSAERFVCFVYLNFVLTVLLRLRILAFSAAGIFIVVMLSLATYPFEPKLAIRSFLILLLVLILVVVTSVYAQVHRDPTLSRITNTKAGELGSDFWLRIAGFAALPTLGLLAAQFPDLGGFLFSWLQPALDALTK
jgi:hypothetical protein